MPDATARDEFLTEASEAVDNKYSPDKFYTASRNKKGFATTIRVNVPPEVLSMLGQLVQSKVIPEYTTTEAFLRDAIVHRIKYVETMIKDDRIPVTKLGKILIAASDAAAFLAEREGIERILKNYEEGLKLANGDERRTMIKQLKESIGNINDDTFRERGWALVKHFE